MIYLDTSYLVRLYVRQEGSQEVHDWLVGTNDWTCCLHGRLEIVSALKRQHREGQLSIKGVTAALRQMEHDEMIGLLHWLPITAELIRHACDQVAALSPKVYLRAADALHLATAADAGLQVIYSHDRHLLAAARHFRLKGVDILAP